MKKLLSVLVVALVIGSGCSIHFTPSQISGLISALQTGVASFPDTPPAVIDALNIAQQAITADASGAKWPAIARVALMEVYQDLPAKDQNDLRVAGTIAALEAALQFVGA